VNPTPPAAQFRECLIGTLLGTAVGDALGLPMENLAPESIRRRWPEPLRMRFIFGRGMISDDTEHTLMVAQALLSHPDDPVAFQRALGWRLRWWFLGLPAGVGLATARACLHLWIGFPADKSGVISGGSGAAMRSAIIGAYFADDSNMRREFVLASSRLTHRSWQAETAALAVSESAALAMRGESLQKPLDVLSAIRDLSQEKEWQDRISQMETSFQVGASASEFACSAGLTKGVTGYSLHVVPVAIYAWLRHNAEFRPALSEAIACGGDTDTVGAIVGALCGCTRGVDQIPGEWLESIWEWPRSRNYMRRLGVRLAEQKLSATPVSPVHCFWPGQIPRNALFLMVVLAHGFRRLLP